MKRFYIFLLAACLLSGCGKPATSQTANTQATETSAATQAATQAPTQIQTGLITKDEKHIM